jgi:hypothetical protein
MEKASNCLGSVYDQEVTFVSYYTVMKSFTYKELAEGTSSHPTKLMAYDLFGESMNTKFHCAS